MTNFQLLIYFVELVFIFFLSLYLHRAVKPRHSEWVSILLLLSTWIYMMVFFYSMTSNINLDVYRYIKDSKIIYEALLKNPWENIVLMISPGGNYYIPKSAFPYVLQTSSWSNPTFYFLVKIYAFFGILSSFNLYNISLWFVFTAFISKLFLLRLADRFEFDSIQYKYLVFFLLLGGSDILYVSSMLKDNITFLLVVLLLNSYYSEIKYRNIYMFLFSISILYIRPENIVFLSLGILIMKMIRYYIYEKPIYTYLILVFILVASIVFYITPYYEKVNLKIYQFLNLPKTTTSLVNIDSLSPFVNFDHKLERLVGVIYTPLSQRAANIFYYVEDVYNVLLVLFIFFLVSNIKWKRINKVYHLVLYALFGLSFIAIIVPNFGSQIRYRAIYMIFLIFSLIYMSVLNNVKINIFKNIS